MTTRDDMDRMRSETGAAFAMVGRAALRDPWFFGGHAASRDEVLLFLADYHRGLRARGFRWQDTVPRLKQLVSRLVAGGFGSEPEERREWMSDPDPVSFLARMGTKVDPPSTDS